MGRTVSFYFPQGKFEVSVKTAKTASKNRVKDGSYGG